MFSAFVFMNVLPCLTFVFHVCVYICGYGLLCVYLLLLCVEVLSDILKFVLRREATARHATEDTVSSKPTVE